MGNLKLRTTAKKIEMFLKNNRVTILQMGVIAGSIGILGHALDPSTCLAVTAGSAGVTSTGITALDKPLGALSGAMTGTIPKVGVTIAAAAGGTSWALGTENQVTKYALRACMGGGIAMAAPSAIDQITGTATGILF